MRAFSLPIVAVASLIVTFPSNVPAADWPCWRGIDGLGVSAEKGFPTDWSPTKNVAWKLPLAGKGASSPVIVGNRVYVWRSGVGVDAHGNLVYVAGPGLNVETLAELLRRAGCVRAMELDINTWWDSFTSFTPDAHGGVRPTNLLSSMVRPADRYLIDGTRDFVEIDARH